MKSTLKGLNMKLVGNNIEVTPVAMRSIFMLTVLGCSRDSFGRISKYISENLAKVLSDSEHMVFQGIDCYEISRSVLLKEEYELPSDTIAFCFDEEAPTDLPEGQYTDGIRQWVKMEYPNGDVDYDIAYIIREEGFCC